MVKKALFMAVLVGLLLALMAQAQAPAGYSAAEFEKRRLALMEATGNGLIILLASPGNTGAGHFRQDNDFYYFTGCEDANAILVMIPATKDSYLFVPQKTDREKMMEGGNSLDDPGAREKLKLKAIYPVSYFDEFLSRLSGRQDQVIYLRLSPEDSVGEARSETALFQARRARNPYNAQAQPESVPGREVSPALSRGRAEDITPRIDVLRMIKTPEEIAILRQNGRISAEAVKRAMLASRPGAFEYELEAAAVEVLLRNGCRGPAYPPIIGSGPNTCILHYEKNNRAMQAGELVLMDFGGDLNYLTMDITRTWPVSGKFSEEQKRFTGLCWKCRRPALRLLSRELPVGMFRSTWPGG